MSYLSYFLKKNFKWVSKDSKNDYKLSNKANLNINKNKDINMSIPKDPNSIGSYIEVIPENSNTNTNSGFFTSRAMEKLTDKDTLVKLFVRKMNDLAYSPGINGELSGYLFDSTSLNETADKIISSLDSKCAIISEAFLICVATFAADQTDNLSSVYSMIDPAIFTYENVISSHFNLLDA